MVLGSMDTRIHKALKIGLVQEEDKVFSGAVPGTQAALLGAAGVENKRRLARMVRIGRVCIQHDVVEDPGEPAVRGLRVRGNAPVSRGSGPGLNEDFVFPGG